MDRAARFRGYAGAVRTEHGPGFTSRDECLNEHWFTSLVQASEIIGEWRRDHNEDRPHSSCSLIPPARFAANHRSKSSITAVPTTPCFASNHLYGRWGRSRGTKHMPGAAAGTNRYNF